MPKKELLLAAENPPDLTRLLSPERVLSYSAEGAGLKLLFATERINPSILETLFKFAKERNVVEQNRAMQKGELVNFIQGYESERRPALHTAMRNIFGGSPLSEKAHQAACLAKEEVTRLEQIIPQLHAFKDLVQVGIGGSSLGPEAAYLALKGIAHAKCRVHFLSNVDPDAHSQLLKTVDLPNTLFLIVSKSGTTLETVTYEMVIRKELEKANLDPKKHLISITVKGSQIDQPTKYRASFYIWDYIGGRYSTTSMVGGVLLALAFGLNNYLDFLKGAQAIDAIALEENPRKNLPLLGALFTLWNRNFLNYPTVAIIPYSQGLSRFPAHLQQLFMESNGKQIDREGHLLRHETSPVVWGEPGTNGQHSFFQLIHQGTTPVPVEFIGFAKNQSGEDTLVSGSYSQEKLLANLIAQSIGLATGRASSNPNQNFQGNRPSHMLLAEQLTPFTLGNLFSYYEHKATYLGSLWNINSFDQEGVQLGKQLSREMIQTFIEAREGKNPSYTLGKAYLKHLLF